MDIYAYQEKTMLYATLVAINVSRWRKSNNEKIKFLEKKKFEKVLQDAVARINQVNEKE